MNETAVIFGREKSLVGVITHPKDGQHSSIGAILLNAGLNPHVGPNRLYVRLARRLAQQGMIVLRFDLSGIGDSHVRTDKMPFEEGVIDDTRQAMHELAQSYGVEQFIFMGHCAGAAQSFLMGIEEDKTAGVVLMNPQNDREDWREYDRKRKVQQYYQNYYGKKAIADTNRWWRFLTGKVDYRSIFMNVFKDVLWSKIATQLFRLRSKIQGYSAKPDAVQQRVIAGFRKLGSRKTPLLFIYSNGNTGFEALKVMLGKEFEPVFNSRQVQLAVINGTDHTFTLRSSQDYVIDTIANWCQPLIEPVETPIQVMEKPPVT
jgi:pimeloyl-ACP methyl ester carboxylesterase